MTSATTGAAGVARQRLRVQMTAAWEALRIVAHAAGGTAGWPEPGGQR